MVYVSPHRRAKIRFKDQSHPVEQLLMLAAEVEELRDRVIKLEGRGAEDKPEKKKVEKPSKERDIEKLKEMVA